MVPRLRDLSSKYRSFRHPADAIFDSLTLQTLFNKFMRRGKKATARRAMYRALVRHRMIFPTHNLYPHLMRHIINLGRHVKLVMTRKGKQHYPTPMPVFRMKATVGVLQRFYFYASREKVKITPTLARRIYHHLEDLTENGDRSVAYRDLSTHYREVFEAGVHLEKR